MNLFCHLGNHSDDVTKETIPETQGRFGVREKERLCNLWKGAIPDLYMYESGCILSSQNIEQSKNMSRRGNMLALVPVWNSVQPFQNDMISGKFLWMIFFLVSENAVNGTTSNSTNDSQMNGNIPRNFSSSHNFTYMCWDFLNTFTWKIFYMMVNHKFSSVKTPTDTFSPPYGVTGF